MTKTEIVLRKEDKKHIVEDIVYKWNELVSNVQNLTISLCLYIQEVMKDYDSATIKEVMEDVKKHPKVKRFVSIDRIWQGMRLIKRRPDVIEFMQKPENERKKLPDTQTPILKKDGDVFIEAYFELEKAPLDTMERNVLEEDAKEHGWSYRELKDKIRQRVQEVKNPGKDWHGIEELRKQYTNQIIEIVKSIDYDKLPNVITILQRYRRQNEEDLKE